jgi:hypothetical protein
LHDEVSGNFTFPALSDALISSTPVHMGYPTPGLIVELLRLASSSHWSF